MILPFQERITCFATFEGTGSRTQIHNDIIYSWTSNKGPSKKGTLYIKSLYNGHRSWSQKNTIPIASIHWEPLRRGQPLYNGQNSWIYIVPIVSLVWRFHCMYRTAKNNLVVELQIANTSILVNLNLVARYRCTIIIIARKKIRRILMQLEGGLSNHKIYSLSNFPAIYTNAWVAIH